MIKNEINVVISNSKFWITNFNIDSNIMEKFFTLTINNKYAKIRLFYNICFKFWLIA